MAVNVEVIGQGPEDDSLIDPDSLDKNFHYRFVQSRPNRMARARKQGYKPVQADEIVLVNGSDAGESADNLVHDGDRILMKVPKERKKERDKEARKLRAQRMKAPVQSFKNKAERASKTLGKRIRTTTSKEEEI